MEISLQTINQSNNILGNVRNYVRGDVASNNGNLFHIEQHFSLKIATQSHPLYSTLMPTLMCAETIT